KGNLVLNGDFEDVNDESIPTFWQKDAWKKDESVSLYKAETENPHSGQYCVSIENIQNNDARLIQRVRVKPNSVYKLSCFIRAENVGLEKTGANITVMHPKFMAKSRDLKNTGGQWEYVDFFVQTAPGQQDMIVAVRLGGFGGDNTGKAYFDDFKLEEATDLGGVIPETLPPVNGGTNASASQPNYALFLLLGLFVALVVAGTLIFTFVQKSRSKSADKEGMKTSMESRNNTELKPTELEIRQKKGPLKLETKDYLVMGAITLIYAAIALFNLGSIKAPEKYWKPSFGGESFYVDFGSPQEITKIAYYEGIPDYVTHGRYRIEFSDDAKEWHSRTTLEATSIFYWYNTRTTVTARYARLTVETPKAMLMELAFVGKDDTKPLPIKKIVNVEEGISSTGTPENLFDEQDTYVKRPSFMSGMSPGFDEMYHARTAFEKLNRLQPYETTHPPMGKNIIAIGVAIFGMNPFGWRIAGTFLGILMIPLIYIFAMRLFRRTEYAALAAYLMAFDFMHFVQTRISTIDTYGVFFIILMYYFMYKYYEMDYFKVDFHKTLPPLLLAGVFWGFGAASKWIVIYAGLGLAAIFLTTFFKNISDYKRLKASVGKIAKKEERRVMQERVQAFPTQAGITILWCVLVFIIIPAIIYFLSYIPFMMVPGQGHDFGAVLQSQIGMFDYHTELQATHPFSTPWYEWPLIIRPMWYYGGTNLPGNVTERIVAMGNPAVWWVGSLAMIILSLLALYAFGKRISRTDNKTLMKRTAIAFICSSPVIIVLTSLVLKKISPEITWDALAYFITSTIVLLITPVVMGIIIGIKYLSKSIMSYYSRKGSAEVIVFPKNKARFLILMGFASQYLPWTLPLRTLTFIYHFFASVPFIIFALVYLIKMVRERILDNDKIKKPIGIHVAGNVTINLYLIIVLILFCMFYPVLAGMIVDAEYAAKVLRWMPQWPVG
ncbi:MAG: glycosyltransferase family 39 protein, partial [Spirochaetales bacterium]|nr:glycosyltransferase family 39 protein [Spirochaetales bacterium]